jgi:glycosyltransferase involved in cell wall biosynthesis
MKHVLHVTEELSKKNYSISSLIFFLSEYIEKNIKIKHTILTTYLQREIFKEQQNVKVLNLSLLKNFFTINKTISFHIKNVDIVHIHGLWRWINFIVVFYCIINGKNFYVHPHGMLLKAALKNKGLINFIIKNFVIFFYKIISRYNVKFISITNQETLSIKRYFKNVKIKFIPNPIPFNLGKNEEHEITKTFVFFGRIHPIKNLELMIDAFKLANLDDSWKLHIYGIDDDKKYLLNLKEKIKNLHNIEIKNPIFGNNKQKILNSSWANILLSKSEVLSLSVLESASMELPSIVSEEIQIDQFTTNEGESVKPNVKKVSKKITDVSNWSLSQRKTKGKLLKKFIEEHYSIEAIAKNYFDIYEKNNIEVKDNSFNFLNYFANKIRKYPILNTSLSYILNLMIPTFMMVLMAIIGNSVIAAEVALINSFWLTLTQIFSSNIRSQAIAKNDVNFLNDNILIRVILSIIATIIILLSNFTFFLTENTEGNVILKTISLIILSQWVFELVLTSYEIKKETLKTIFINLLNISFCIAILISLIFTNLFVLNIYLFIYLVSIISIILLESKNIFTKNLIKIFELILNNIRSIAFFSSFSLIFSSFVWRYLIFIFYSKEIAAVFFACFSVGSFPATIFNSSFGPTFIRQKIRLGSKLSTYLIILFLITIALAIFSFINLNYLNISFVPFMSNFVILTLSFSIAGSFIMTYAMYLRQLNIQSTLFLREKTFLLDTLYGSLITILLPILYYFDSIYYVSLTFFLASLIGLIVYGIVFKLKFKSLNT